MSNTVELLKAMKLSGMANELVRQIEDGKTYNTLGFEERLSLLVDAEWVRRQINKLDRNIKAAHFSIPSATVEGIEYHPDRRLDKAAMLRYSTCQYIKDGHHIVLKGAAGSGKTYIACALGNAACRKFKKVRYIRMPELLDELNLAKAAGEFKKVLRNYQKADLLIASLYHNVAQKSSLYWLFDLCGGCLRVSESPDRECRTFHFTQYSKEKIGYINIKLQNAQ